MSAGLRLKDHLRQIGEIKAKSSADDIIAHLSLSPGERLERVARLSNVLVSLSREAGRSAPPEDDRDVWLRVYQRLHRLSEHG